ncbi:unnamed protein product [Cladocopium goreaui]|uniref:Ankyrin repeat domain-containing protein 29 n=1 Tax=Cladocopium goreaui TaxID=2562237 RepID=A0A9P1CS72_9DINO|nr:unnamed protein product [Cladocopium goreaui]
MGEAPSDHQLHVARVAVHLCAQLADGMQDVEPVLKPIQNLVANSEGAEAMPLAVQTLSVVARRRVEASLRFNPVIPLTALAIGKDAAGRCAWAARESLHQFASDGNGVGQAYAQLLAGYAHIELMDSAKALKAAVASEELFKSQKNKPGEAAALCCQSSARLLRAMAGSSPQLQLAEDKEEKVKAVKKRQEEEAKAGISSARAACCIYSDIDDRKSEAACLTLVGELMLAKDEVDEAKNVAREARDIFQDLEDPYGEARALNLILSANMLHEADAVDALFAAKDVLWLFRGNDISEEEEDKKAVNWVEGADAPSLAIWDGKLMAICAQIKVGGTGAIADGLHGQAKVHFSIGELSEAKEVAQEALKYYQQAKMSPKEAACGQGYALQTLAHTHCAELSPDEGLPFSEQSVELFATAGDVKGQAMAKAVLAYQDTMSRMKQLEDTPQAFTQQSNARVTENWTVIEDAMAMMRDIRNQEGEDTIGSLIYEMNQKVGEIQKKMSTPTKTVWTVDKVTRKAKQKDYYEPVDPGTQLATQE